MKILIYAINFVYPIVEGETIRNYNLIKYLKEKHDFDLVTYFYKVSPEIEGLLDKIYVLKKPAKRQAGFQERAGNLIKKGLDIFENDSHAEELSNIIHSSKYDLIWLSNKDLLANIPKGNTIPVIAYSDEEVLWAIIKLKASRSFKQLKTNIRILIKSYLFEKHFLKKAVSYVFPSERDANSFKRLFPNFKNITVITNGVDADFFKPLGMEKVPDNIVFSGSLDFGPNIDGALYFCRKIFPIIQSHLPESSLTLIGKNPALSIRKLESEKIRVIGYVDDVRPFIDKAKVYVCSNKTGSGIKNTILQAWAMEKAVVATSVSAGGLKAENNKNIVIEDHPKNFAHAVISLLRDEKRCEYIGKNARLTVLKYNVWQKKSEEMDILISRLTGK